MSILDDTRALLAGQRDKLQAERERLAGERDNLTAQIAGIDSMLKQLDGTVEPRTPRAPSTSSRRSGIRDDVYEAVKAGHNTPAMLREHLGLTDKSGAQAVSNALSALKKSGKLTADDATGAYSAAP